MSDDFILIFPHIPKTGGTSMLYHFRQHLGDDRIVVYGPFSRTNRLFQDKMQLEEMSEEQLRDIKVIQGHGVDEQILRRQPLREKKVMVILREPVRLTRSRFNQRNIGAQRWGTEVDAQRFLKKDASNALALQVISNFPSFADDPDAGDLEKAFSILKKFDFVYTTESMEQQSAGLMQLLGLPTDIERRRVAEKKVELPATDEFLASINQIDSKIFEACNHVDTTSIEFHNPLGFDADGKAKALRELSAGAAQEELDRADLYTGIARSLCRELLAEATMQKIEEEKDGVAIRDLTLFSQILEREWKEKAATLSEEQLQKSHIKRKRWKRLYRPDRRPKRKQAKA